MALRIGFDLDGVLADMEEAIVREAVTLFGSTLPPRASQQAPSASMSDLMPEDVTDNAPLRHELQLTTRQRRQLWRHIRGIDGFWESLDEIEPGSVQRLAQLANNRRWEIIFLTRRPATAGPTAQIQSQRWLEKKGFRLPSVYVVTGSRGLIATALALDIVVDDTPENCVDVASDSKARTIAIFRDQERVPPDVFTRMGIHLVDSTAKCLDLLVEIDSSLAAPQPSRIERVMRSLGLKERTSA
ncbi:MAG: 5' nucleotidase, NT5C type [Vicinamibacterales bacterium]